MEEHAEFSKHRTTENSSSRRGFAFLAIVTAIASVFGLAGCTAYTAASGPQAQSPAASKSGVLAANRTNISFGAVPDGWVATQSVTITNTGAATVNISQTAISGDSFALIDGSPSSILAGQSAMMQVRFAPHARGTARGSLLISGDATDAPLSIPITGDGMEPDIAIAPSTINFGNVGIGQTKTQGVTLTNTGNVNLVIQGAAATGSGFSISGLSLPVTIGAGQSVAFNAQFMPAVGGGVTGLVTFTDNAPSSPQTMVLAGSGVAATATLIANPGSVTFGTVAAGASATQTITLTNSGTSSATISSASISGAGFSMSGLTASETIGAGQTVSFTAKFSPASGGNANGAISIASNAPDSPVTIALNGTGAQGALSSNPSSLNFGTVQVGTSVSQTITLTNSGTGSVTVSGASSSGAGFSMSGLTPQTINAGQSVSFSAQFAPGSSGSALGSITINSSAPGSPTTIALSGTGTQGSLGASPSSFNFGNVQVGGTGNQTIQLTNSGTATVTVSSASISGAGFSVSGLAASQTIGAGQTATFTASFSPASAGSAAASIAISSNAPGSPLTIALSGTGTQPQLSATPSSVAFSNVTVGNTNSQTITVKNGGNANLTISQASASGSGFGIAGLSLQTPIPPGTSITFNATFAPLSAGSSAGSVSLVSNAPNSPFTIPLSGTGIASSYTLAASPASVSFGSVDAGQTSSQSVTLTNTGNSNVTISGVSASGTGFSASGIAPNLTLSPNQSAVLTVSFAPAGTGSASGNVTIASNASSATTIPLSGTGAPASHSVVLSWAASTSAGVTDYNVYRGTSASGPYMQISSSVPTTSFTDTTVLSGQTYYYAVTALGSGGAESAYSNTVSATIP